MTRRSTADVVVIGSGIAGASAAWALSRELDVALLELEPEPGRHATGRSAAVISETSGAPEVCALAAASRRFLADPPRLVADSTVLGRRGLLWVADAGSRAGLPGLAAGAEALGVRVVALDPEAARAVVPVLRRDWLAAALLEPDAMSIDVARLLSGFLGAFRRQGGVVHLATPVTGLEPAGDGWRVTGPELAIDCATVVDAAGAWADEVAVRAGVTPLGLRPLLRTAFTFPVADTAGWPLVMDAGGRFYFEPEGPGLLVSPADETPSVPCDARPDELAMAHVTDALAEATTLRVRGVRSRWAGLRTFARDRLPVVGVDPTAPGFFWLAGQGGAGIKTAPALAELTAAMVCGTAVPPALVSAGVEAAAFSPARLR